MGERDFGISVNYIMSFLKHLTEEEAIETLKESIPYKHLIHSVGLDSTELGNPPQKFEKVMKMASEEGYRLVSHAGEEGPAEYVRDRIDHGVRSVDDDKLVERIAKMRMPLTLCPLSNL